MIGIVNYGLGNLNSIQNVLRYIGSKSKIVNSIYELNDVKKIILPGVGSFDNGMKGLIDSNWVEALGELVCVNKIPVMGICLGMQLMCKSSEEGSMPGLGWIDADVRKFDFSTASGLKIPHMGWNTVTVEKINSLIPNDSTEQRFYFVHSYYVSCNEKEDVILTTDYGLNITTGFNHENIFGVQFHPEKSHKFGIRLLTNFNAL